MEDHASRETSNIPIICPYEAHGFVKSRRQRLRRFIFLVLTGTPSLERLLEILEQKDQSEWNTLREQLIARTSNVTVIGSLVATGAVSFVTTQTPSPIANWDETFPYICFLAGGLSSAMCVVSGLGLVMFLNAVQPETVREIRMSTFRFSAVAALLGMPIFWFAAGLGAPLIGMTGAIWVGNSTAAKAGVVVGIFGITVAYLVIFVSLY